MVLQFTGCLGESTKWIILCKMRSSVCNMTLSKRTPCSTSFFLSLTLTYTHASTHTEKGRVQYTEEKAKSLTGDLHSQGTSPSRDEVSRLFPLKGEQCHTALLLLGDLSLRSPAGPRAHPSTRVSFHFSFLLHLLDKWDEVSGSLLWDLCSSIYLQVWLLSVPVTRTGRDFI